METLKLCSQSTRAKKTILFEKIQNLFFFVSKITVVNFCDAFDFTDGIYIILILLKFFVVYWTKCCHNTCRFFLIQKRGLFISKFNLCLKQNTSKLLVSGRVPECSNCLPCNIYEAVISVEKTENYHPTALQNTKFKEQTMFSHLIMYVSLMTNSLLQLNWN